MTPEREKQILWYLIGIADEYGVPWMDYFSDEEYEYRREVEPMAYWDAIMFLADKRLAAATLKAQQGIIDEYKKADTFLAVHGWKWR